MKTICYWGILLLLLFPGGAFAQTNAIVTGTVLDESAKPIEGVTVTALSVKDTTLTYSTSTNSTGVFRFSQLPANTTYHFRFTHVGFQNYAISNFVIRQAENNSLLVRMPVAVSTALEEVVVVGYGTQQKVNLTGAVNQVNGEDFRDRPVTNISSMLQGAIPNLNIRLGGGMPGQMGSLNVRGITSISGSNATTGAPLVLIDGIPGTLDRLSPEEVQSITVLKDASSAAVYGAR